MKSLYKSPVITVEELYKKDVLCQSGDTYDPTKHDSANASTTEIIGEIGL